MAGIIQRIDDPEIFFGIVSPIGVNVDETCKELISKLQAYDYRTFLIHVTDVFDGIAKKLPLGIELKKKPLQDRYNTYIKYGDALRAHFNDDSFLAGTVVDQIRRLRATLFDEKHVPERVAYVVRQFKRREEIDLLRSAYGKLFFQISVYSRRGSRVDNLAKKIAHSNNIADLMKYRTDAEDLVRRDENDIEDAHGQRVSDVFHEADLIVNTESKTPINSQVGRFVDLIFGSNVISPTKTEYGLYIAKSASLRTLDLSRQVGAAIFSPDGEIMSMGANEVPKGGGGTYWCDDPYDDRDFKRKIDSNEKRKREIFAELINVINTQAGTDLDPEKLNVKRSQFMDALEYGRIIHAEMSAITDAARLGRGLKNSILYCTTFPCHMCAKHIVASGIDEVIFLEPYPKSLANDLHDDSIEIEGQSRSEYDGFKSVTFKHFQGVSPRRYRDLFERQKRKGADGSLQEWRSDKRQCIVDIKTPVYLKLEGEILKTFLAPLLTKAGLAFEDLQGDVLPKAIEVQTESPAL